MKKVNQIKQELEEFNKKASEFLPRLTEFEERMNQVDLSMEEVKASCEEEIIPLIEQQEKRLTELRSIHLFIRTGLNIDDKVKYFFGCSRRPLIGIIKDFSIGYENRVYFEVSRLTTKGEEWKGRMIDEFCLENSIRGDYFIEKI